ncbi:hypothetical protein ON010_g19145 [Phytophthora cinnamomi]|nr:hypothetical protein ON010_g19145 [Phytophthora cinnamomi]
MASTSASLLPPAGIKLKLHVRGLVLLDDLADPPVLRRLVVAHRHALGAAAHRELLACHSHPINNKISAMSPYIPLLPLQAALVPSGLHLTFVAARVMRSTTSSGFHLAVGGLVLPHEGAAVVRAGHELVVHGRPVQPAHEHVVLREHSLAAPLRRVGRVAARVDPDLVAVGADGQLGAVLVPRVARDAVRQPEQIRVAPRCHDAVVRVSCALYRLTPFGLIRFEEKRDYAAS